VSNSSREATVVQEIEARGLLTQWARNIRAAVDLLNSANGKTVVVTDLALPDGNWRDLVERVSCVGEFIPIVLVTHTITAELWWDALECNVQDILTAPLVASRLFRLLETLFIHETHPL
jgi:DNA-binding NtrC family response regulator